MHRFHSPDSCGKPSDHPSDETRSNFPGTSLHGSSGDSDAVEQAPDSPSLHPGRKPDPSTMLESQIQGSSPVRPLIQQFRPRSLHGARVVLNNMLQRLYGSSAPGHIRWETSFQGPPHNPTWHATAYIDDVNYGHGTANTKGEAYDKAAIQVLENLDRKRG